MVVVGIVVVVAATRTWGRLEVEPDEAHTAPAPATMTTAVAAPMSRVRVEMERIRDSFSFGWWSASPALDGPTDERVPRIARNTGPGTGPGGNMGL